MKVTILFACFVILLSSCSKSDDNIYPEKTFTSTAGTSIKILGHQWSNIIGYNYTSTDVICKLSTDFAIRGETNGDSIKIKFNRNGETIYKRIDLDVKKYFAQTVVIADSSVLQTNIPAGVFTKEIEVIVFKGPDSLKVPFKSEELRFR